MPRSGAVYLMQILHNRGVALPITAWGTTICTGRKQSDTAVSVNTVRSRVDLCTVPEDRSADALALCTRIFSVIASRRAMDLLAITLSNLNPQNHMGIALGNITRMERGETWSQGQNVTPKVGRLLEELDRERLAIAGALGLEVKTIFEHFHLSFHVPVASISEMNQQMHAQGNGGTGPATADSRYVTEDVPYGLVPTAALGRLTGHPAPLHEAGYPRILRHVRAGLRRRERAAERARAAALRPRRPGTGREDRAADGARDARRETRNE